MHQLQSVLGRSHSISFLPTFRRAKVNDEGAGRLKKRLGSRRQPDAERSIGWSLVALVVSLLGLPGLLAGEESALAIRIVEQRDTPVIGLDHPDVIDNRHGFEGGRVIKLDGVYHLFTAEMYGNPFWVKMRLAHWISGDRLQWTRRATIGESSGDYEGRDPRAATWACMPVFNDRTDRWEMFYVAYRCKPGLPGYEGRIWRAASQKEGSRWHQWPLARHRRRLAAWSRSGRVGVHTGR